VGQSLIDRLAAGPVFAAPGISAAVYAPLNLNDYVVGMNLATGILVA
jgi:hypothetical protein